MEYAGIGRMEIYTVVVLLDVQRTTSDFYVDEFGLDRSLRSLNYYPVGYWWEDIFSRIKTMVVANGEDFARGAWRNEWGNVAQYAEKYR